MKERREIVLTRRLEVQKIALMLTIREFDSHDEILSVLKLFKRNRQITREDVNEELLFMPPDSSYGQNVLEAVKEYGLIKEVRGGRFELTSIGEDSIQRGEIPIPKKGVYSIVVSNDLLLTNGVLDVEPYEIPENGRSFTAQEVDIPVEIKSIIESCLDKTINLTMSDMRPVIIEEYGLKGYIFKAPDDLKLSLHLKIGGETALKFFGKKQASLRPPDDVDPYNALKQILSDFGTLTTVKEEETLLVSAENLKVNEIMSFSKSFRITAPMLKRFGYFDPVEIHNFSIMPSDEKQAILWASRLLVTKIDNYVAEPEYNVLVNETAKKFQPLYSEETIKENLAGYQDALRAARNREKEYLDPYWYLMAPYDLSIPER